MWCCSVVVEWVRREGEVTDSNQTSHVIANLHKNTVTCDFNKNGGTLANGGLSWFFCYFFFWIFICQVLFFVEGLTIYTRRRALCQCILCRVLFAECYTLQRLSWVYSVLCWVCWALGKANESRSVGPSRLISVKLKQLRNNLSESLGQKYIRFGSFDQEFCNGVLSLLKMI